VNKSTEAPNAYIFITILSLLILSWKTAIRK